MNDAALFTDAPAPEAMFTDEPAPEKMNWSDVPGQAMKNAPKDALNVLAGAASALPGASFMPGGMMNPAKEGDPSGFHTLADALKAIPKAGEDLVTPEGWAEHPVGNLATLGSLAVPGEGGGEISEGVGKAMEEKGGNMGADLANMSGTTVQKMKPNMMLEPEAVRTVEGKANPEDLRAESGKRLIKEGIVGGAGESAGDIWQKARVKENDFGKSVEDALDAIRKKSPGTDQLEADAVLGPISQKTNELGGSARSGTRQQARFWNETLNSLTKKASANAGKLGLDDIRSELQDVGEDLDASPKTPRYQAAQKIYGHLADLRDQMVEDIAKKSGDPQLADNLTKANKGYSFYSRLNRGLDVQAAAGGAGKEIGNYPMRAAARGRPMEALGYMGVMPALNALKPALAQKLVEWGPGVAKYGKVLEAAAKKGLPALTTAHFVLKQRDPQYRKLTEGIQ